MEIKIKVNSHDIASDYLEFIYDEDNCDEVTISIDRGVETLACIEIPINILKIAVDKLCLK